MDFENLYPAPWEFFPDTGSGGGGLIPQADGYPMLLGEDDSPVVNAALQFAVLARNAFDVMVRRGWGVLKSWEKDRPGWFVVTFDEDHSSPVMPNDSPFWSDPFSALVEADRWMKEQEKNSGPAA